MDFCRPAWLFGPSPERALPRARLPPTSRPSPFHALHTRALYLIAYSPPAGDARRGAQATAACPPRVPLSNSSQCVVRLKPLPECASAPARGPLANAQSPGQSSGPAHVPSPAASTSPYPKRPPCRPRPHNLPPYTHSRGAAGDKWSQPGPWGPARARLAAGGMSTGGTVLGGRVRLGLAVAGAANRGACPSPHGVTDRASSPSSSAAAAASRSRPLEASDVVVAQTPRVGCPSPRLSVAVATLP